MDVFSANVVHPLHFMGESVSSIDFLSTYSVSPPPAITQVVSRITETSIRISAALPADIIVYCQPIIVRPGSRATELVIGVACSDFGSSTTDIVRSIPVFATSPNSVETNYPQIISIPLIANEPTPVVAQTVTRSVNKYNQSSIDYSMTIPTNMDSGSSQEPGEVSSKIIPVRMTVSRTSFIGIESPTSGAYDTVANNDDGLYPEILTDHSVIQVDSSAPAVRLITGTNEVKLSIHIEPTFVLDKVDKASS